MKPPWHDAVAVDHLSVIVIASIARPGSTAISCMPRPCWRDRPPTCARRRLRAIASHASVMRHGSSGPVNFGARFSMKARHAFGVVRAASGLALQIAFEVELGVDRSLVSAASSARLIEAEPIGRLRARRVAQAAGFAPSARRRRRFPDQAPALGLSRPAAGRPAAPARGRAPRRPAAAGTRCRRNPARGPICRRPAGSAPTAPRARCRRRARYWRRRRRQRR